MCIEDHVAFSVDIDRRSPVLDAEQPLIEELGTFVAQRIKCAGELLRYLAFFVDILI